MSTDATNGAPQALPAGPPPSKARQRALAAGRLVTRLAFDLLVIDAVVESWLAGSPIRLGLAAAALLYFLLTAYVLSKGGRIGSRGWLMDPVFGAIVFLGFLAAASWSREWVAAGVTVVRHASPVVFPATMTLLVAAAAVRMVGPGGATSWWLRAPLLVVYGYACIAFWRGIADGVPLADMLRGKGYWGGLPWWGQGTWIGAFLLLPLACARELGASIARLAIAPYLRWLIIFGLGCWIASNVAGM